MSNFISNMMPLPQGVAGQSAVASPASTVDVLRFPQVVCTQLDQPFERDDIRNDAHMSGDDFRPRYPSAPALIWRLNEVFGHLWSDEIVNIWNTEDGRQVLVHCRLSIPIVVAGQVIHITKDGVGMAFLKLAPNGQGFVNYGYDVKAAHTDGLRKAATNTDHR